jgi:hypothetical protein
MAYSPTTWTNRVTTLGPTNLNKLEQGVANAAAVADNAMSAGSGAIPSTQKGAANGVAPLDSGARVPLAYLPAGTPTITYGTTPPASPADGDLWMFPADATNGVIWQFRYRAASASAYKWEFIGGTPALARVETSESLTTPVGSIVDLATVGPQITLPRDGDYQIYFQAQATNSTVSSNVLAVNVSGTSWPDGSVGQIAIFIPVVNTYFVAGQPGRYNGITGSRVVKLQYQTNGGTATFLRRVLSVTPIRVS